MNIEFREPTVGSGEIYLTRGAYTERLIIEAGRSLERLGFKMLNKTCKRVTAQDVTDRCFYLDYTSAIPDERLILELHKLGAVIVFASENHNYKDVTKQLKNVTINIITEKEENLLLQFLDIRPITETGETVQPKDRIATIINNTVVFGFVKNVEDDVTYYSYKNEGDMVDALLGYYAESTGTISKSNTIKVKSHEHEMSLEKNYRLGI